MKTLIRPLVLSLLVAGITTACVSQHGGSSHDAALKDALAAYERKDYAQALRVYQPLAEAGNAKAQFYLGVYIK